MKQSNPDWAKDLTKKLEEIDSFQAKVGWFENAKEEDGTPSAYVASVHEFGYPKGNIPPRLGMREVAATKEKAWQKASTHLLNKVMDGSLAPKQVFETLALMAKRDFFRRINSNPGPPLKKKTLQARRRKEMTHEQTLVATGRMIEGLDILVEKSDDGSGL